MESIRERYPFLVPDAVATTIDLLKNATNAQSIDEFQNYANQTEFHIKEIRDALKWIFP